MSFPGNIQMGGVPGETSMSSLTVKPMPRTSTAEPRAPTVTIKPGRRKALKACSTGTGNTLQSLSRLTEKLTWERIILWVFALLVSGQMVTTFELTIEWAIPKDTHEYLRILFHWSIVAILFGVMFVMSKKVSATESCMQSKEVHDLEKLEEKASEEAVAKEKQKEEDETGEELDMPAMEYMELPSFLRHRHRRPHIAEPLYAQNKKSVPKSEKAASNASRIDAIRRRKKARYRY